MKSFFDQLKPKSQYHFDSTKHDQPGEWFTVFGRFNGAWQTELAEVIANSKKVNWENIASMNNAGMTPERQQRIVSQELDVERGGGDPKMTLVQANTDIRDYPVFERMINSFGLERVLARVHVQMTGQVFNYHLDAYPHYPEEEHHRLIRIIVCLEDWVPGHFYLYGTHNYSHWRAGDFHTFRWRDVPHATANASQAPRTSLIITGLKTARTEEILAQKYTEFAV